MRDEFVDALEGILASLIGGEKLGVEGSNAMLTVFKIAPQIGVFLAKLSVGVHQLGNRDFESIEVINFRGCTTNDHPPRVLQSYPESREDVKRLLEKGAAFSA